MRYYSRSFSERKPINSFGRLGFVEVIEFVKTNNIEPYNKGKRIKFIETKEARSYLYHKEKDTIYKEDGEVYSRFAGSRYIKRR